jgi:hypothetical protein
MKTYIKIFIMLVLLVGTINLRAQGTAFTYQGRLNDGTNPANGSYDLRFYLRDAVTAGNPVGTTNTVAPLAASNGLFTVTLDFGSKVFTGADRWLEIGVRTNGSAGAYTTLSPRQPLTPAPYAILAGSLNGVLLDAQLSANIARLNANQSFTGNVTFNPPSGAPFLVGNTNRVANLNADLLDGLDSGAFWKVLGNTGTVGGSNFLGTADNQPLELKVNNQRGLRLEPTLYTDTVNVIGGSARNFTGAGVAGATIGGGGAGNWFGFAFTNRVEGNFGTVSGATKTRFRPTPTPRPSPGASKTRFSPMPDTRPSPAAWTTR